MARQYCDNDDKDNYSFATVDDYKTTTVSLRSTIVSRVTHYYMLLRPRQASTHIITSNVLPSNVLPDRRRTILMLVGTRMAMFGWYYCPTFLHSFCPSPVRQDVASTTFILSYFLVTRVHKRLSDRRWMI
jgi:hypothetical protein